MSIPHPDTIADLAPDCRRALSDAYMRIQAARQRGDSDYIASATADYRSAVADWADGDQAWADRVLGVERVTCPDCATDLGPVEAPGRPAFALSWHPRQPTACVCFQCGAQLDSDDGYNTVNVARHGEPRRIRWIQERRAEATS